MVEVDGKMFDRGGVCMLCHMQQVISCMRNRLLLRLFVDHLELTIIFQLLELLEFEISI